MSGSLTGSDPLKGWLMGFLGLFTAQIGLDGIHAQERFTFGWSELTGGIALIPALVGALGFAEILIVLAEPAKKAADQRGRLDPAEDQRCPAGTGRQSCARA